MTIVIAGGSGFLGRKLVKRLEDDGHSVTILTRRPTGTRDVQWNPDGSSGPLPRHLDGQDAVINLAGEGIADRRWSATRKAALRNSRILATQTLVRAVAQCAQPPKVFISASAVGYYGPRGDEPITEAAAAGSDFLSRLCVEWEQEARMVESPSDPAGDRPDRTRVGSETAVRCRGCCCRSSSASAPPLATGDQFMPWIHVADWTALVSWLVHNDRATGAFNAAAPTPVTNRTFTRTLGRVLKRPAVLHAPAFVLRAALGEMSTILVNGQRVLPAAAEQLGFRFTHRELEPALRSVLGV